MDGLINALWAELGTAGVMSGTDIGERHRSDRSLSGQHLPMAVLRPASTKEVSAALRLCHEHGVGVVPQGGMTGLAGGANAGAGEIVLSLERMTGVEEIDTIAATMTVLAGTPLETAQTAAEAQGFLLGLDLGSRGSCQVGGNISTNAGGYRVIRYGMARAHVMGLEAVLADGTVVSDVRKMLKNNTGYDWKQLFIGAEGTLGIITRAVLRLAPKPATISTAMCAINSFADVLEVLKGARRDLASLTAFEVMWKSFHNFSAAQAGLRFFAEDPPFILIIEQSGNDAGKDAGVFESFLGRALEQGLLADCLIAQSQGETAKFWKLRETLVLDRLRDLVNFDVSLDISRIGEFADHCAAAIEARWPGCHHSYFGHIGDGNLHVCVSAGPDHHAVDDLVYGVVRQFNGSISAEHGIGTLKKDYLGYSRSPEELALMARIKQALDPKGILNPGKVL
ncbi:MAG: FAD-binding oxidoreductase [Aestuariivirgaceae bacterium]|nr:FAD-binding oxidoreductase [Aestuariivirgaceae bacterium]